VRGGGEGEEMSDDYYDEFGEEIERHPLGFGRGCNQCRDLEKALAELKSKLYIFLVEDATYLEYKQWYLSHCETDGQIEALDYLLHEVAANNQNWSSAQKENAALRARIERMRVAVEESDHMEFSCRKPNAEFNEIIDDWERLGMCKGHRCAAEAMQKAREE
jgi:hypothetical protein